MLYVEIHNFAEKLVVQISFGLNISSFLIFCRNSGVSLIYSGRVGNNFVIKCVKYLFKYLVGFLHVEITILLGGTQPSVLVVCEHLVEVKTISYTHVLIFVIIRGKNILFFESQVLRFSSVYSRDRSLKVCLSRLGPLAVKTYFVIFYDTPLALLYLELSQKRLKVSITRKMRFIFSLFIVQLVLCVIVSVLPARIE